VSLKILVTGVNGFIGRHLVPKLLAAGYEVVGLSRAEWDLTQADMPLRPDVAHIVHLAARSYVPDSWTAPTSFYETNVIGTARVLEVARKLKVGVTFVSSYVYGQPSYLPIDELHPVKAWNPYAHSKLMAESLCDFYAEQYSVPVCIIRPFNVYGPGQASHFLIPYLLQQLLDPGVKEISIADRRPRRDYIFVGDLADLLADTCRQVTCGVYNAASGSSHSIEDIISISSGGAVQKAVASRGELRPNEILDIRGDFSRANQVFGWSPTTVMEAGLLQTLRSLQPQKA
jgi:nucleoside-diphosphate-sugar epimerase